MLKVALTGGIATGKTHVLRRFGQYQVPTIDADDLVHEALRAGTPESRAIADRFGADVLAPDGAVNRKVLAARVFDNADARHVLEAILHPAVYRAIGQWFVDLRQAGSRLCVADVPLLYETGYESAFDVVIVTACDPEEQVRRFMQRDGATEAEARLRLVAQMPIAEKVKRATFVVWTTGTLEQTDRQVDSVLEELKRLSQTATPGRPPIT